MHRLNLILVFAASVFWSAGCGGSDSDEGPETASVSGTVYLDDKPLANAQVQFTTSDFSATGVTNAEGKYTLAQGAVPGENKVSIIMWKGEIEYNPEEGMDEGQFEAAAEGAASASDVQKGTVKMDTKMGKQVIPAKYNTASTLTFSVPQGGSSSADFRLTSN